MNQPRPLAERVAYLVERTNMDVRRGVMRARGGALRPDWPQWLQGLAQFFLGEERMRHVDAYRLLPDIYFCTSIIQDFIAGLPIKWYEGLEDARVELPHEKGTPGFVWDNGNDMQSGYEVMHDLVGFFLLAGNGYLMSEFEKPVSDPTIISSVFALPGHLTTPVLVKHHTVGEYVYDDGSGKAIHIPANQVMFVPDFTTDINGVGMPRLDALALTYMTQRDAARYQRMFYKRGAQAAGIFTSETGTTPPLMKQLRESLQENTEGAENSWRPVVLPRGVKFERAGLSHTDMQFVEAAKLTKADILQCYKVPPTLAGQKVGGLGGSDKGAETDMTLFLEHGIKPITRRLTGKFNKTWLRPDLWHGRVLTMEFDFSDVAAVRQLWLEAAKGYAELVKSGLMRVNEARQKMGMEPDDELDAKGVEKLTQPPPVTNIPGGEKPTATPKPKKERTEDDDAADLKRSMLRARAESQQSPMRERMNRCARRMFWQQEGRVVAELNAQLRDRNGGTRATLDLDKLLTVLDGEEDRALIRRLVASMVRDAGKAALAAVGIEVAFSLLTEQAQAYIKQQTYDFITHANHTSRAALRKSLAEGVAQGERPLELVARVREVFGERKANAQTIAVTEAGTAYNAGQLEGFRQSGVVKYKEWLTAEDEMVRGTPGGRYEDSAFNHAVADGYRVPLDQPFFVGDDTKGHGEACMFPGDPQLSAGNRINCRCTMLPVTGEGIGGHDNEAGLSVEEILKR